MARVAVMGITYVQNAIEMRLGVLAIQETILLIIVYWLSLRREQRRICFNILAITSSIAKAGSDESPETPDSSSS